MYIYVVYKFSIIFETIITSFSRFFVKHSYKYDVRTYYICSANQNVWSLYFKIT